MTSRKPWLVMNAVLRAAPLDQRVGGERGAVNQLVDLRHLDAGNAGHLVQPVDDRLLRLAVTGQHLGAELLAAELEHDIGKGAADIRADTNA